MTPLTGKARTITPVVTIKPLSSGRGWHWDVWWQTSPGKGPCRHGKTATRLGARFAAWRVAR